jgi:hypothetical protein
MKKVKNWLMIGGEAHGKIIPCFFSRIRYIQKNNRYVEYTGKTYSYFGKLYAVAIFNPTDKQLADIPYLINELKLSPIEEPPNANHPS